ncbi:MAG: P27 family phage terminase small subunit [Lachnospiraceae bacterium]|nr:P27 family phage terminase small subunit [Lachnospiraceae bacterium]
MNAKSWKKKIKSQMEGVGVYNKSFDSGIDALADILEQRDKVKEQFEESGGRATVIHTLDRGEQNAKINPLLRIWMDLNTQALNYWNSLGLTGKSYKQMTGSLSIKVESKSLEDALSELGI